MSKIFFVMNDRNDTSKGYTQVSQEYVKKYIDSFTEGRAYFINLGHSVMETDEENYRAFYKERRREKYIIEEAIKNGVVFGIIGKADGFERKIQRRQNSYQGS